MSHKINIGFTEALDKKIAERTAETTQLKRSRNSLLNVARIPPEILGYIFYLCILPVIPGDRDARFASIRRDSRYFLLVCHHWFEVACCTSELWSSWGNNLEDWKRHCLTFETFPLDLVLDGTGPGRQIGSLDETLRDALRDRAARGTIRRVHLRSRDTGLLTSIVSSLTPEGEGVRPTSIQSIVLGNVDVYNFFARHRFPVLRSLSLYGCPDLAWDHLKSHTTALVNLSLCDSATSPTSVPTTSQVLSLLASNPGIRTLELRLLESNNDNIYDSTHRVPLRHLKRFSLMGNIHNIFPILQRLELSDRVDYAGLTLLGSTLEETRQVVGPHIRDYLRRDARFGDKLCISILSTIGCVSLQASVLGVGYRRLDRIPNKTLPGAVFTTRLPQDTPGKERDRLCIDILTLLPRERVVTLETNLPKDAMEELFIAMPNIEVLHLASAVISEGFLLPHPDGPNAHKKLLPSLQWLCLDGVVTGDGDWDPLVLYLTHQTSGNHPVSLGVFGKGVHICSGTLRQIGELVREFIYHPDPGKKCPFNCRSG